MIARSHTTWPSVITMGVYRRRRLVATARHGEVRGRPINAAACTSPCCHAVIYDCPTFAETVIWLRDHLATHGIEPRILAIDLGIQPRRSRVWWTRARHVVRTAEQLLGIPDSSARRGWAA